MRVSYDPVKLADHILFISLLLEDFEASVTDQTYLIGSFGEYTST